MRRTITLLVILLGVQVLIAVALGIRRDDLAAYTSSEKLLGVDLASVDEVLIEEREKQPLRLLKREDKWVLPDRHDFPVSSDKFERTVEKLVKLTRTWPLGTTKDAARRFKLTEKEFERKISFNKKESTLKTLYLGSSPEFRKVNAKLADEPVIYPIEFSTFEVGTDPADWYDKDLFSFGKEDLSRAEMNAFVILEKDGKLALDGQSEDEETVEDKLTSFVSDLGNIAFTDLLGVEVPKEAKDSSPAYQFRLELKSGEKREYSFWGPVEDNYYVMKVSSQPYYFKIIKSSVDNISKVSRSDLLKKKSVNFQSSSSSSAQTEETGRSDQKTSNKTAGASVLSETEGEENYTPMSPAEPEEAE